MEAHPGQFWRGDVGRRTELSAKFGRGLADEFSAAYSCLHKPATQWGWKEDRVVRSLGMQACFTTAEQVELI